jgi:hypothetical protein
MGNVTRPQKAENASCITNSLSIGNRSGDSRCGIWGSGLATTTNYKREENHEETDNSVRLSR